MQKIKVKDEVIVIAGRDKGKRGEVTRIYPDGRVMVSGINMVKKHVKPNPQAGVQGGIVERSAPMDISNVAIFNPKTNKADRVGIQQDKGGKRQRVYKSDGEAIESK